MAQPTRRDEVDQKLGSEGRTDSRTDSRVRIIEALWRHPGLSRIELAERLGMDKSTMSRGVSRLLDSKLLFEAEAKDSGPLGGRRRMSLELHGDWGLWLGLELQPDQCRGVLVDLAGEIRSSFVLDTDVVPDSLGDVLTEAVNIARQKSRAAAVGLKGAGLAVPGPVRPGTGIVERSRPLGIFEPLDISRIARDILGLPVAVANDVDWACRGELHFTEEKASDSFLYLLAETRKNGLSLGLGIVLEGTVHRGDHGASGEILSVYRKNGSDQLSMNRNRVGRAGTDPFALREVAEELAPQVAMVANVMDIDRLILGGLMSQHFDTVSAVFSEALRERRTYPDLASPEVIPSARRDQSVAYGAAIHFTENPSNQDYWRTI